MLINIEVGGVYQEEESTCVVLRFYKHVGKKIDEEEDPIYYTDLSSCIEDARRLFRNDTSVDYVNGQYIVTPIENMKPNHGDQIAIEKVEIFASL